MDSGFAGIYLYNRQLAVDWVNACLIRGWRREGRGFWLEAFPHGAPKSGCDGFP